MFGEMLMLPYTAMQSVIDDELATNPALQRLDAGECPICRNAWRTRCPVCSVPGNRHQGKAEHRPGETADAAMVEPDTQVLLRAVRMETSATDAAIVEYVVGSLDQHGLLDRSCAQLAADLGVPVSRVAHVLDVVRRTGPPGVGRRMCRVHQVQPTTGFHVADQVHAPAVRPVAVQVNDDVDRRRARHRPPLQHEVGRHALMAAELWMVFDHEPARLDRTRALRCGAAAVADPALICLGRSVAMVHHRFARCSHGPAFLPMRDRQPIPCKNRASPYRLG